MILSQEIIYQNLSAAKYTEIITLLHQNGNSLDLDPSVALAIRVFMDEFFKAIANADLLASNELNQDLDILYISHRQGNYVLQDEHAVHLINLLHPRVSDKDLYPVAKEHLSDPVCLEITKRYEERILKAKQIAAQPYRPDFNALSSKNLVGQKFEVESRTRDGNSWVKVFLRTEELLDTVAEHLRKLTSVDGVNITTKSNGKKDLTVYPKRLYGIEEVEDEVKLNLNNYFSRNEADPIFREEILSGISDVAYFQILDYMLKLGMGLEGFKGLSEKMDEERYRDYFVNYLDSLSNSHTATGETFHGSGKSDILIRNAEKEVLLVAECKLWNGAGYLGEAVDQLFERYVTWRDGKAALLIFNTKIIGFTRIIDIAVEVLITHPLCISYDGQRKETSFSFTFRNLKDPLRSIKLELVMFNFV
ncbi:hypothetical protein DBR40_07425 [Pedobacter sp. KBW01]|uniref:hypothetical protein n=1 Tax=Pedobacter sp. KBW01 TaxID=2153364 RepID=UPI000F5A2854|nr:hypothetical protein [Pedobacter sp. KBW01]RQO77797.1 hypothetical protein DBR40_07425 [Pedobacter sp. KBW01]